MAAEEQEKTTEQYIPAGARRAQEKAARLALENNATPTTEIIPTETPSETPPDEFQLDVDLGQPILDNEFHPEVDNVQVAAVNPELPAVRLPSDNLPEVKSGSDQWAAELKAVTAAIASTPTTFVGGAVSGLQAGQAITVANAQIALEKMRATRSYLETWGAWQNALANTRGTLELIAELKHHGVFPENTEPKQALQIAAEFMTRIQLMRIQMRQQDSKLLDVEKMVVRKEVETMRTLAEGAGEVFIAPYAGMAKEAARIPGMVIGAFGTEIVKGVSDILEEGALVPAAVVTAFALSPLRAFFRGMNRIFEEEGTVGAAAGGITLSLEIAGAVGYLIWTGASITLVTAGGAIFVMLTTSAAVSLAVEMWRNRGQSHEQRAKLRAQRHQRDAEDTAAKPIEGTFEVIDPKEEPKK